MSAQASDVEIEQRGPKEWALRVTRSLKDTSMQGEAVVLREPHARPPAHAKLAGARAWRAIADASSRAGAATRAASAARRGLDELGRDYRPRRIKDDTGLRILAAEDQIERGRIVEGARSLIEMLDTRMALYVEKYSAEVR